MPNALDLRSALTFLHHDGYGLEKPDPRPAIYHSVTALICRCMKGLMNFMINIIKLINNVYNLSWRRRFPCSCYRVFRVVSRVLLGGCKLFKSKRDLKVSVSISIDLPSNATLKGTYHGNLSFPVCNCYNRELLPTHKTWKVKPCSGESFSASVI